MEILKLPNGLKVLILFLQNVFKIAVLYHCGSDYRQELSICLCSHVTRNNLSLETKISHFTISLLQINPHLELLDLSQFVILVHWHYSCYHNTMYFPLKRNISVKFLGSHLFNGALIVAFTPYQILN